MKKKSVTHATSTSKKWNVLHCRCVPFLSLIYIFVLTRRDLWHVWARQRNERRKSLIWEIKKQNHDTSVDRSWPCVLPHTHTPTHEVMYTVTTSKQDWAMQKSPKTENMFAYAYFRQYKILLRGNTKQPVTLCFWFFGNLKQRV